MVADLARTRADLGPCSCDAAHLVRLALTAISLVALTCFCSDEVRLYAATIAKPLTGRDVQAESTRSIPWSQLDPHFSGQVRKVVKHPCMFRRMPTEMIRCDRDLFSFLIRYPEVVANIWQLMGISKVTVQRVEAKQFTASDGAGTTTDVRLVYDDGKTQILYCQGEYQGPLFKRRLRGNCVLILSSSAGSDQSGATQITARMDVFLRIEDLGIDVLTRTLHPLLGKSADRNFVETLAFVEKVSRTAEENGPGMERLASRLAGVDPAVRTRFAEASMAVYQRQLTLSAIPTAVDSPYEDVPALPHGDYGSWYSTPRIAVRTSVLTPQVRATPRGP
ncbi:MAG: hypothetical protein O2931_05955 [Planctomycetota bacterium]|nr:hypothetical protein [Planctomycetota bacterium]MDA1178328.1 hypothetical protein [Planctomycetota bacterium]